MTGNGPGRFSFARRRVAVDLAVATLAGALPVLAGLVLWLGLIGGSASPTETYLHGVLLAVCTAAALAVFLLRRLNNRHADSIQQRIRQVEERYEQLLSGAGEAIIGVADERIVHWNRAAEDMLGWSADEVLDRPIETVLPNGRPPDMEAVLERVHRGETVTDHTCRRRTRGGRIFPAGMTVSPLTREDGTIHGHLCIVRDESERQRLEHALHQAQKMESIGTLAGGIAHDFNNILSAILSCTALLRNRHPDLLGPGSQLEVIEDAALRAAELTEQLLSFARGGKYEVLPVDINQVVRDTYRILDRTLDKSIAVRCETASGLPAVEADAGQLHHALLNIGVNARDAMPDGGNLVLSTRQVRLDEAFVESHPGSRTGDFVCIGVSDTGMGMKPDVVKRIFDPFFTTKEPGQGTGLGLAMVYGIVKNHGGYVDVTSAPGRGTRFDILLPASTRPATRPSEPPTPDPEELIGSETILVVDDEKIIRSMLNQILGDAGYNVVTASDGEEALRIHSERSGAIDMVILDMVMPGKGGAEVFEILHERDPHLPVLLSSGYSPSEDTNRALHNGAAGFLQKPYRVGDLLESVRSAVGTEPAL